MRTLIFCCLLLTTCANSDTPVKTFLNTTLEDTLITYDPPTGPWSSFLEDWTTRTSDHRLERIVRVPQTHGYYITDRVDVPPAPPTIWSEEFPPHPPPPGKIASKPPQYNNYPKPKPPNAPYQMQSSPSRKEVSDTDIYLLGAIEKLVYRVDFMEKRLRKAEELLRFVAVGAKKNPEPCPEKYIRVGNNCYAFVASNELNWKSASTACKDMGATLAEMETIEENQDVVTFIQANAHLNGKDYWTDGLNPGLLWIWSHSARPVTTGRKDETQLLNNMTNLPNNPVNIRGNGRCLKLAYNPAIRSYAYMGHDCAEKQFYICEKFDKGLSNEIQRIAKSLDL